MIGRPNRCPISKKLSRSTTALDDPAHMIRLLRSRGTVDSQRLVGAAPDRPSPASAAATPRPTFGRYDRNRRAAANGLFLGVDRVIHRAAASLDLPPAEFLLAARLAQPLHDRRAGHKDGREVLDHDGIMARRQPRRAKAGDRAQAQRHHRHRPMFGAHRSNDGPLAQPAGQIGPALGFDRLDRPAAAGALDQPDERQPQLRRHLLRQSRLPLDRGIRRAAAHA